MDLFILKTDVEKFTSTNKKTLHLIFKVKVGKYGGDRVCWRSVMCAAIRLESNKSNTDCVFMINHQTIN